jgi:predicted outer membrane repeat protein
MQKTRGPYRLQIEPLEDRVVPSNWLVTNTSNNAGTSGSLPWAVAHADTDTSNANITFSSTAFQGATTITLASTLTLSNTAHSITIDGSGAGPITISGNNSYGGVIVSGATVTIQNLTLTAMKTTYFGQGGGIVNSGTLSVNNVTMTSCAASELGGAIASTAGSVNATSCTLTNNTGVDYGAGVFVSGGTATLSSCTISNNSATYDGGAIYVGGGSLSVDNCMINNNNAGTPSSGNGGAILDDGATLTVSGGTVDNNTARNGGGISIYSGSVAVTDVTISDNYASTNGGGIISLGTLTVTGCTLSANTAAGSTYSGGGIINGGTLTVVNSIFTGNAATVSNGGGIYNDSGSTATVIGSTFSANSAVNGAAIYCAGTGVLTVNSSTITANTTATVSGNGGGLYVAGIFSVVNSTITSNSAGQYGGGIYGSGSTATLVNTIVAANSLSNGTSLDITGSVSGNNNLIGNGAGMSGISNGSNGNQVGTASNPINPLLNPLANNGGPTQTMSEQTGSPALNMGGAVTTLSAAVADAATTTITVANLSRLAASALATLASGYYFTIQIDGEQMGVLGASSSSLTVIRGINGTKAVIHSSGASVYVVADQRGFVVPANNPPVVDVGAYESTGAALLPAVASLSPNSGATAGGTTVIITGANFTDATAVMFGATSATTFTINSDSQITATDPAGSGVVDVTVVTSVGTSAVSSADEFTYLAPPSTTSVVINQDLTVLYNAAGQPFAGAQRSMVDDIVYTFSEPVSILSPAVDPSLFIVAVAPSWNGTVPTLSWAAVAGSGDTEWAVTFSGNGVTGGSIANGAYTITVADPSSITAESDNQALNLAPSGIGGATQSFFRLFGDINGDEYVNAADNAKFKQAMTTYNAVFDDNQDGFVNACDNCQLKIDLALNFSGFTPTI